MSCARCGATCDDSGSLEWTTSPNNTIPFCESAPTGSSAPYVGTTVQTLELDAGYYRVSNLSRVVFECHNKQACKGGANVDDYCAEGYTGPCECNVDVRVRAPLWAEWLNISLTKVASGDSGDECRFRI